MEIRVKYENGKAHAILIENPKENYTIDYGVAVSACLEELYSLLDSVAKTRLEED